MPARPYGKRQGETVEPKEEDPSPPVDVVRKFHANAPVDVSATDIHHTLGLRNGQASPGNHIHDGSTSKLLLSDQTLTGSKASPSTVLPSIIACLVRLGATDNTT
jgi:hypothetical protein